MSKIIFIFMAGFVGYFLGQISVLYKLSKMSEESFFRFFFRMYLMRKNSEDKK